jgi:hypothetical protein
MLNDM